MAYENIEIRHLRYFMLAAECGSFRKASISSNTRESTISRRIRDLENLLGTPLFCRHSGGVNLTLAGQSFLERTRTALQQIDEGARDLKAKRRAEESWIKIGIFSSLGSGFLFELLCAFEQAQTEIRVELIEGNPSKHLAAIHQFQIDIAFIAGITERSDCESEQLWSEGVFAALPRGHRLATKRRLDWHDLADESFIVSDATPGPEIYDFLMYRLASLDRRPKIQVHQVGRNSLLSMVAIGCGVTIASEATASIQIPGVVYRPIVDEVLPFSAIWLPRNDNPACRRLLNLARSMARRDSGSVSPQASSTSLLVSHEQSLNRSQ